MFYSQNLERAVEEGVAAAKSFAYGDEPSKTATRLKSALRGQSPAKCAATMSAFFLELEFRQGKSTKNYVEMLLEAL